MSSNGFIKLHRKLLDCSVFQNEKLLKVWIWCLLSANHTDKQVIMGNTIANLEAGQFIFGRKTAAEANNLSESTFYRMMNLLKDLGMISLCANNKWTVATVENWRLYQCEEQNVEQQRGVKLDNKRTAETVGNQGVERYGESKSEQQMDTNNNIYNIYKKDSPTKQKKPDRKVIPPTLDMVSDYCTERSNGINPQYFIDYYSARDWYIGKTKMKDWQAAVRTWENNNKQRNKEPISAEVKKYDI